MKFRDGTVVDIDFDSISWGDKVWLVDIGLIPGISFVLWMFRQVSVVSCILVGERGRQSTEFWLIRFFLRECSLKRVEMVTLRLPQQKGICACLILVFAFIVSQNCGPLLPNRVFKCLRGENGALIRQGLRKGWFYCVKMCRFRRTNQQWWICHWSTCTDNWINSGSCRTTSSTIIFALPRLGIIASCNSRGGIRLSFHCVWWCPFFEFVVKFVFSSSNFNASDHFGVR